MAGIEPATLQFFIYFLASQGSGLLHALPTELHPVRQGPFHRRQLIAGRYDDRLREPPP